MDESSGEALDLGGSDPRARALAWYLGQLRSGFQCTTEDEVRARHRSDDPVSPAQRVRTMKGLGERHSALAVEAAFATGAHTAIAHLRASDGKGWIAHAILHPPEPERLRWALIVQAPPPGISIRAARSDESEALAELERRVPVVDGESRRTYERGDDYFLATDTPYEEKVLVAELDGALCGMTSSVQHPARAAGRLLDLSYLRHLRVDPSLQKRGVFSALNGASALACIPDNDAPWSLTAAGNEAVNRLGMRHLDHAHVLQLRIDTRSNAASGPLRTALPADAAALGALLEAASGGLELSRPWAESDVVRRMTGAGSRYGWERVAFTEAALLGVERGGARVITESPAGREERREALACDIAALPDREAELLPLLRAWCVRLADEGVDDLLVTLAHRPLLEVLAPLASRTIPFNMNHQFRVAPDADARGYFVDGMLF